MTEDLSHLMSDKPSWKKRLRKDLVTGLVVLAPIAITLYVMYVIFRFADNLLGRAVSVVLRDILGVSFFGYSTIPGVGLVALLILLLVTGWLARTLLGQQLLSIGNRIISRVPLVNYIYRALIQLGEVFSARSHRSRQRPVLIPYPSKGLWTLGILITEESEWLRELFPEDMVAVFVVTTPNPTTGFLIYVPKKDVVEVNISLEEAIKLIMSGGILVPEVRPSPPSQ